MLLDDKTRREVEGFLEYAEEKATGRVNPNYARLDPQMTVDEAVAFLRRDARDRAQTSYYAYVTDSRERLIGTVGFRDLLVSPGDRRVVDVMRRQVISVTEDDDEKLVRELFIRYNLQMIPVVDLEKRIQRIITRAGLPEAVGVNAR